MSDEMHDTGTGDSRDGDLLEERVRETLHRRATAVDATPALYVRVQDGIARSGRRRAFMLTAAAAVAAVAVSLGVELLPRITAPDIVDAPPTQPAIDDAEDGTLETLPDGSVCRSISTGGDVGLDGATGSQGVECTATAEGIAVDGEGASAIVAALRTDGPVGARIDLPSHAPVLVRGSVTSIDVGDAWHPADGITVLAGADDDGTYVGIVDQLLGPNGRLLRVDASPNGGGVVVGPHDDAVAWVSGSELHLQPVRGRVGLQLPDAQVISLGAVRDDLVLEDWSNVQGLLLRAPEGGLWRAEVARGDTPDANAYLLPDGGPEAIDGTGAASDGAWLPDGGGLVVLEPAGGGDSWLRRGSDAQPLTFGGDRPTRLASAGGEALVLTDDVGGSAWHVTLRPRTTATTGLVESQHRVGDAVWVGVPTPDDLAPTSEASIERRLGFSSGFTFGADGPRLVSAGGNKPDPGAAPFGEGSVSYGAIAASDGVVGLDIGTALAVEVERRGERVLQLLAYTNGFAGVNAPPDNSVPATVELLGDPVTLDGPLDGLLLAPNAPYAVWLRDQVITAAVADDSGLRVLGEVAVGDGSAAVERGQLVDWIDLTATRADASPGETIVSIGVASPGEGTTRLMFSLTDDSVTLLDREPISDRDVLVRLAGRYGPAVVELAFPPSGDVRWISSDGEASGTFDAGDAWGELAGTRVFGAGDRVIVSRGDDEAWEVRFRGSTRPGGVSSTGAPARAAS